MYLRGLNAGGPARMALDVLPLLEGMGFLGLVVVGGCEPGEVSWEEEARRVGLRVVRVGGLGKGEAGAWRALGSLKALIREWGPDLVHTNMARAGLIGRLAARRSGVRAVVHTFHGHVFRGYFPALPSWGLRLVERVLGRLTTRVVAVSEQVASELTAWRIVAPDRLVVVPPGVDLERYLALSLDRPLRRRAGWVGRLVPVKDPWLLAETARRLQACLPEARVSAAGGGPLLAEMRNHTPEVEWLGHVENMVDYFQEVDLLLLTSRNEGLPLALVEAMAAGLPVVATAVGGVPDLLGENRFGLTVEREPEALAQAAARLWKEPGLAAELARTGRIRSQDYAAPRVAAALAALYTELGL